MTEYFSKATSYFKSKPDIDDEMIPVPEESPEKFTSKLKFWNRNSSIMASIKTNSNSIKDRAEAFKYGVLMLGSGFLVIFLSSFYLPFVAIYPQKFCALFTIGSILCISSLVLMLGAKSFFEKAFSKSNFIYSGSYAISVALGLYYSCVESSYLLTIVFMLL